MKNLSFALVMAAVCFLIGCDQQSVNAINAVDNPGARLLEFQGMIKNAGVADFPGDAEVKGSVLYTFRRVILAKGAARIYDVGLETAAEVRVHSTDVSGEAAYNASGKSEERIVLDAFGNSTLTLAYRIEGIEATAYLHIAFSADESQLGFKRAWISATE